MKEYRVISQRKGQRKKIKRYAKKETAERRIALLTSASPWEVWGGDPDDTACCSGRDCLCGGLTVREEAEHYREALPALEYAFIECRDVGIWEGV